MLLEKSVWLVGREGVGEIGNTMKTQAAVRLLLVVGSRLVSYTVGITGIRGPGGLGLGLCHMATSEKPCGKEACCGLTVFHKRSMLGSGPQ